VPARIQLLPEFLINQIAAGEVIERPASVVKELLENSLDADATTIEIDVEDGGLRLIKVTDDGVGIVKDDLWIACCRHATSKIATLSELERVRTLGFRGEALSSIASVAKLKLSSCARGEEFGWEVSLAGCDEQASIPKPSALGGGTVIEVRELFFTTPARRKFLRSQRSEFLQILGLVRRVAMSRPEVTFRLTHNKRQALHYRATTAEGRARQIFGASMARGARAFADEMDGFKLWGWLLVPATGVARASEQYLFLNGRMLRDRQMTHALRQAAEGQIAEGAALGYIVFLEVDPTTFDVNVHPTKMEVRFRDVRMLHDWLYSVTRRVLQDQDADSRLESVADAPAPYPVRTARFVSSSAQRSPVWGGAGVRAPALQHADIDIIAVPLPGTPVTILYGRYLLTTTAVTWYLVDLEKLLSTVIEAELSGSNPLYLLQSIPLLLPEPLPEELATRLPEEFEPLSACGFGLEWRQGVLYLLRVPSLLRGISHTGFLAGLPDALAEQDVSAPASSFGRPWFVAPFARYVLSRQTSVGQMGWLKVCLSELQRVTPQGAGIWRPLSRGELATWIETDRP
jgi:DNA mismatch repair protein MutL